MDSAWIKTPTIIWTENIKHRSKEIKMSSQKLKFCFDEFHKRISVFQNKLPEMLIFLTLRLHFMHLIYQHYFTNFISNLFPSFFLHSLTPKESVTPGMFCLEYFLLHKHSPISYQLAKIANQAEFLPIFRQQLNLSSSSTKR